MRTRALPGEPTRSPTPVRASRHRVCLHHEAAVQTTRGPLYTHIHGIELLKPRPILERLPFQSIGSNLTLIRAQNARNRLKLLGQLSIYNRSPMGNPGQTAQNTSNGFGGRKDPSQLGNLSGAGASSLRIDTGPLHQQQQSNNTADSGPLTTQDSLSLGQLKKLVSEGVKAKVSQYLTLIIAYINFVVFLQAARICIHIYRHRHTSQ